MRLYNPKTLLLTLALVGSANVSAMTDKDKCNGSVRRLQTMPGQSVAPDGEPGKPGQNLTYVKPETKSGTYEFTVHDTHYEKIKKDEQTGEEKTIKFSPSKPNYDIFRAHKFDGTRHLYTINDPRRLKAFLQLKTGIPAADVIEIRGDNVHNRVRISWRYVAFARYAIHYTYIGNTKVTPPAPKGLASAKPKIPEIRDGIEPAVRKDSYGIFFQNEALSGAILPPFPGI